ncbi:hypothetical protein E1B28_003913 [Marasmius oreades]|uniref:Thioredoxin domain-containing protein n=1 Tax=Marasmius oreades TaxID=181124 RepID=A0A9P7UXN6_9AGAR|nr:uncharacterized protein E1B28_003913 [Marasmius oreades]KAG7096483.1 hypothetical protein E1B28_003913 [Marasmius oreades]
MLWKLSRNLPFYLSLCSILLSSTALPVRSTELTTENFKSTVANGVWLIEHFSPYCGHCKKFAPTWDMLVKDNEAQSDPGIRLAQVNCIAQGDLCNANGVAGYPELNIYVDGKKMDRFSGNREKHILMAYMKKWARSQPEQVEETRESAVIPPNPSGEVLVLDPENFESTIASGPTFVKFFAPWCGHCKKLAPVWKQLAKALQQKLVVAEVNCENYGSLCTSQGIDGYPSLQYYTAGSKTEYTGGRKVEQLKSFAEKANGASTKAVTPEELEQYVAEEDVVYVLLHSYSLSGVIDAISPLLLPLLGSPKLLTVQDPPESLLSRLSMTSISPSTWYVVALKDHDITTPAAKFSSYYSPAEISDPGRQEILAQWLVNNRLPTTVELTRDTFQSVMNAPNKPLVVIASVTQENEELVRQTLSELGKKWRAQTHGTGIAIGTRGQRPVVFARMDAEKWKSWMKSMYGVKPKETNDLSEIDVVVADHQELIYYNTDSSGSRIRLNSATSVFSAIEGVVNGKTKYLHSENFIERLARYLNKKMTAIEKYVVNNPMHAVLFVCGIIVIIIMAFRKLLADDPTDRDFGKMGKGGRLD